MVSGVCSKASPGIGPGIEVLQTFALPLGYDAILYFQNDSYGIRTHVTAVKGRCLNRLTKEPHNSPSRARTYNNPVNSRVLYH